MTDASNAESGGVIEAPPTEVAIDTEPGAGWLDLGVTAAVIVVAGYYLYRKLWRNQGRCAECGSKGQGGCAAGKAPAQEVGMPVGSAGGRKSA
jgi:hypothetical protein